MIYRLIIYLFYFLFISSDDEDFKSLFTFNDSDNEDFESEMERESLNHVNGIHKAMALPSIQPNSDNKESVNEIKTNDDLFYDPESDDCDQKWINDHRLTANNDSKSTSEMSRSDATLNCPSCMSLLCLDCQRHDIYKTQYRAMFVFNCKIDFTQKLQFKDKKSKRNRNQFNSDNQLTDNYFAVLCSVCNTQVAVFDKDEVYHFFSVLASF